MMSALILVIFVWALGTTGADKLATVASAATAIVGVSLTFQSYWDQRARKDKETGKSQNNTGNSST